MFRLTRRQFTLAASAVIPTAVIGGFVPGAGRALADHHETVGAGGLDPVVAVSPDGATAYLAWFQPAADHSSGMNHDASPATAVAHSAEKSTIQFARSTDGGVTFTDVVTASGDDDDVISLSQSSPAIALGANGEIYLVYSRNSPHEGVDFGRYSLRMARSTDGGASFDPAIEVFSDPIDAGIFHDLLVGPDGAIYVSWLSERQYMPESGVTGLPNTEVRITRSDDGGLTFGPSLLVDDLSCECCRTTLTIDPDGTLLLAWRDQEPQTAGDPIRNHVIARSSDRGQTWDTPNIIHDDAWRFGQCPESGPTIRDDGRGHVHAAWFTGVDGGAGVYYALSEDGGRTFSNPTTLVTDDYFPHANVVMALDSDGQPWIAFDDVRSESGKVSLVRIAPDGSIHSEIPEETTGRTPALAISASGPILTWVDGDAVRTLVIATSAGGS